MLSALAFSSHEDAPALAASLRRRRRNAERVIVGLLLEGGEPDEESAAQQASAWREVWDAIPLEAKVAGMRANEAPIETALRYVREAGEA